jgi:polyisoprenoid-binding protein YceI
MRTPRLSLSVLALGCVLPALVYGALKASEASVSFTCTGPGGLHIEGKSTELLAESRGEAVVVTVPLAPLSTGIGLRDSHMHEKYLESKTYPTAELSLPRAGLQFPAEGARVEATAPGTLSLHGTSRAVTVHYTASRRGAVYDVSGDVHIEMNDFGITTPSYLGIKVKPPVDIAVTFRLLES